MVHNAKVYIAGRSETKARLAIEELKSLTGGKEALFLYLDLASLRSVREAATKFKRYVGPWRHAKEAYDIIPLV